jgi:methionyl-tRNA formyltransferase
VLILLTDHAFSADLQARLAAAAGPTAVRALTTLAALREATARDSGRTRLVCAGSGVIVPPDVLQALAGPAYNFHPGPPEYRGLFPSVFALYDGARAFGVTCHEMTAEIDGGPIVAVERFAIPPDADRAALDALTYRQLCALLGALAPALADVTRPLPRSTAAWSGPVRRRADVEALCRLPPNVNPAEFARRHRALGEGPHHALSIELFGQRFALDNPRGPAATRGGREIG